MGLSAQLHPTPGSSCRVRGARLCGSRASKSPCLPGGLVIRPDTGHCTGKGALGMALYGKACPGRAPQTVSWSWWVRLLDLPSPRTRLGASLGGLPSPVLGWGLRFRGRQGRLLRGLGPRPSPPSSRGCPSERVRVPIFSSSLCSVAHSCPTLCDPLSRAHRSPLFMGFSSQEY